MDSRVTNFFQYFQTGIGADSNGGGGGGGPWWARGSGGNYASSRPLHAFGFDGPNRPSPLPRLDAYVVATKVRNILSYYYYYH